jgi:hypothetical protein
VAAPRCSWRSSRGSSGSGSETHAVKAALPAWTRGSTNRAMGWLPGGVGGPPPPPPFPVIALPGCSGNVMASPELHHAWLDPPPSSSPSPAI